MTPAGLDADVSATPISESPSRPGGERVRDDGVDGRDSLQ